MPRTVLDQELRDLNAQIMQLGSLADDALAKALESLEAGDQARLSMVIEADNLINNLCATTEKQAIHLLILQQPLAGRDMRYLTAALHVIVNLARAGNIVAEIAQIILRMISLHNSAPSQIKLPRLPVNTFETSSAGERSQITETSVLRGLLDLGAQAHYMLQKTMEAFASCDASAARSVENEAYFMDMRYQLVCSDLMTTLAGAAAISALQSDSYILQRVTHLLWIAHRLEQLTNLAKSICKRIIFIVEGETDAPSTFA